MMSAHGYTEREREREETETERQRQGGITENGLIIGKTAQERFCSCNLSKA